MSRIFFIRHGQASFFKSDYDQLSDLGRKQSYELGHFWQQAEVKPDKIYAGNLVRQKQTAEHFLKGLGENVQTEYLREFDEHHGPDIVRHIHPEQFKPVTNIHKSEYDSYRKKFYATYFKLAHPWVRGELTERLPVELEQWDVFRSRFKNGLEYIFENTGSGSTVLIFTSGGPVGAAVGESLELSEEKTIELGWQVKNTSISEFLYGRDRFSLVSFNQIPHLRDRELITLV